jgi:hypothetical protein
MVFNCVSRCFIEGRLHALTIDPIAPVFRHAPKPELVFLPYRPLPFLAGIGAQIRPKEALRTIRKLLMRRNFRITLEKLGRQKINSPSRHHDFQAHNFTSESCNLRRVAHLTFGGVHRSNSTWAGIFAHPAGWRFNHSRQDSLRLTNPANQPCC